MVSGIAQVAAQGGAQVRLYDLDAASLLASQKRIEGDLATQVAKSRMPQDEPDAVVSRLSWTGSLADLANSDIVIEAVIEDASAKQALFSEL
jgi:3-hydroxybutyryl-CoA dehydrogenase